MVQEPDTLMSTITLACAQSGESCVVLEIATGSAERKHRLYGLGITPGITLEVMRFAPLGDPMQLKVGSSFISIRRAEAAMIKVEIQ